MPLGENEMVVRTKRLSVQVQHHIETGEVPAKMSDPAFIMHAQEAERVARRRISAHSRASTDLAVLPESKASLGDIAERRHGRRAPTRIVHQADWGTTHE